MVKTVLKESTKKKLLKLADFLAKKVKPSWFDIYSFASKGFTEKKCGTTACACGWATVCFPRSGLQLVDDTCDDAYAFLSYKGEEDFVAAAKFFGITIDQSVFLFQPSYDENSDSKKGTINRIRKFVKNNGEIPS